MRVGIVSNTNIIKQNKETNFKGGRKDNARFFITAISVAEGKIKTPSSVQRAVRKLLQFTNSMEPNIFAQFLAKNRKGFSFATRVLKPQEKDLGKKKRAIDELLEKAKQTKCHEIFNFTVQELLPKVIKAEDEELGKYFVKVTEVPQGDDIHRLHCNGDTMTDAARLRVQILKEFGTEQNLAELIGIKNQYCHYDEMQRMITEAVIRIQAAPKT